MKIKFQHSSLRW